MLAPRSRLHYRVSEIPNLDSRLVTTIYASYLQIAMWLANDDVILSPKFGRDQPFTSIILRHFQNDTWAYPFLKGWC